MLITQTLSGISRMLREHHGEGRKLALKKKKKSSCVCDDLDGMASDFYGCWNQLE